ncbi:hypothetical protein BMF94_0649 [Rhodotorula taiwanensis]|uniref:Uncharacterized protein n=1 Tax=Rhodotorula taiwanensis TaxID=741276 RepID=A0A2S5BI40_9BASI|nr:hypothetical protein BMF94_0649 [Rhodotorula taiwanensis]
MAPTELFMCYGIFVTGRSLFVATIAWQQLAPVFRQIEAIKRKRISPLATAAVYALPNEIWERIERDLNQAGRVTALAQILGEIMCDQCDAARDVEQNPWTWDDLERQMSEHCDCELNESHYDGFDQQERLQICRSLLVRYELLFPCIDSFRASGQLVGRSGPVWSDTANLVCLPSKAHRGQSPSREWPDVHFRPSQEDAGSEAYNFDLRVPNGADRRFERIVQEQDLQLEGRSQGTLGSLENTSPGDSPPPGSLSWEEKLKDVGPKWHLVIREAD